MAFRDHMALWSRYLLHVCMVLLCATKVSYAQRLPFHNLNVEDGLIQSQPSCLAQDKYGNLWIGTIGGLSRYDGKTFTNYTIRNGLQSNRIRSLAADNHGHLWVGGPNAISQFDGKTFRHYMFQSTENINNSVKDIQIHNDTVWCLVGNNVYNINSGKVKLLLLPERAAKVSAMLPDGNNLWLANRHGSVYRYNQGKWDSLSLPLIPNTNQHVVVTKFYKDHKGRIWLTTDMGLYRMERGTIFPHEVNGLVLNQLPPLSCITEDNSGTFWIGIYNGVLHLTDKELRHYNSTNGLSDNAISAVLNDAEGNVWMASNGQGVFRFSGTQFTSLTENTGIAGGQIRGIAADKSGRVYFGSYQGKVYMYENGKAEPLAIPVNLPFTITTLYAAQDGKLWIGTEGLGLLRYDKILRVYMAPERNFPSTNTVTVIRTDEQNRMWIGFLNGLVLYERDTFKYLPSLKDRLVADVVSIGRDSVLLATDNGIMLYDNGIVSNFKTNTILDSFSAECFTIRGHELWTGTSDNGVICYNLVTHSCIAINKNNGLQSDFIYNIVTDDDNNVWLGTGYGIHKVTIDAKGHVSVSFYGTEQGISGMESNQNAVAKLPDGSIWFGTTNGAFHYQPNSYLVTPKPISIVMQSVKLFGEAIRDSTYYDSTDYWYNVPYHLQLPYQKNNITFAFEAVTLTGSRETLYRYHLDGLDAPWSDWTTTNAVTYSALPPGKYTFKVQCAIGGAKQTKELVYPFEIITPFHKTGWFRLALFGLCILLGISMQYVANRRKQRRQRLLSKLRAEEQAKIRMRTAEDFHDEVGNKLTRINVLTNVLKSKVGHTTEEIDKIFDQIQDNTGQLYSGTKDILWSLQPTNDNLYEVLHRIRNFGHDLFQYTEIEFEFTGTDDKWREYRLPLDVSRNLIMIWKEALNNCLKYAQATHVTLDVQLRRKDILQLVFTDNGKGFDVHDVKRGHGINNMNVRAARIHARLYIDSRAEKGTIITLTFRLPAGSKIPSNRG